MDSTPASSFSSDDIHQRRGRPTKRRGETPPKKLQLPLPDSPKTDIADDGEPKVVEQAYQTIWDDFCGLPRHEDPEFYFAGGQEEYELLYERLDKHEGLLDHFELTRKTWDSDTGRLTLHYMLPSPLHDLFAEFVSAAIRKELERIETIPQLRPFCRKIVFGAATRILQKRKSSRAPEFEKSPDAQWLYSGERHPPLMLEVAYSQSRADLVDKVRCCDPLLWRP